MTRPRGHTKRRVLATLADHPDWSSRQLADHLQLSRDYVRATASRYRHKFITRSQYPQRVYHRIVSAVGHA